MISEQEIAFVRYWELHRTDESTFSSKIRRGLPVAVLFTMPIILLLFIVRIFLPDWYTKIAAISTGTFVTAIIAMIAIILFYSYFRMQYKWEINEQLYRELKAKENKANNQTTIHNQTDIHQPGNPT